MQSKNLKSYQWTQWSARQRMSPFPNYLSMEAICSVMKKTLGKAYSSIVMAFQGNTFYLFMDETEYDRIAEYCLEKIEKNPRFLKTLVRKVHERGKVLLSHSSICAKKDLSSMSDSALARACGTWEKKYKELYAHYFPIITSERILAERLRALLRNSLATPGDCEHAFTVLTKEYSAMVSRKEEEALLSIASQIRNKKLVSRLDLETASDVLRKKQPILHRLIVKHVRAYYWVTRDYEDPSITYADVVVKLKKAVADSPSKKLAALRTEEKKTLAEQKSLLGRLKLTAHELALFQAFRDGVLLKEMRKKYVSQSLAAWDPVLIEIGKRAGLTLRQVRFLKTADVVPVLKGKELFHVVNERIEKSLWWCHPKADVLTGASADAFFKEYIEVSSDQKSFQGTIVSSGTAKGRVKIVMNPTDVAKIEQGDILVTVQAVPSMAPAFKKASAVIADGGTGITSHTATLAREVGIPGLTGAKIATRLLRDGDLVEVDAIKGIVSILT